MGSVLVKALALVVVAVGVGFAHSKLTSKPPILRLPQQAQPQPGPPPAAPVKQATPPPPNSEYHITVARAKELYDSRNAIFVDARNWQDYKSGHIPGSMWIDKKHFDGIGTPKKIREYLPGQAVVIYCHGEDCTDSEAVAKRLIALNMQIGPIYIIKEGLPGWTKAGHAVEVGEQDPFPV